MGARRERRGRTCVNTDVAHPCRECNSERDSVNIDIAPLCAARAGGAATSSAKALPSEPLRRTSRSATSEQHPALINFFFWTAARETPFPRAGSLLPVAHGTSTASGTVPCACCCNSCHSCSNTFAHGSKGERERQRGERSFM